MRVVVLRLLIQIAGRADAMDHAAAHRDGGGHDVLEKIWTASAAHSCRTALRDGKVDGFCEVERNSSRIPEICKSTVSTSR